MNQPEGQSQIIVRKKLLQLSFRNYSCTSTLDLTAHSNMDEKDKRKNIKNKRKITFKQVVNHYVGFKKKELKFF